MDKKLTTNFSLTNRSSFILNKYNNGPGSYSPENTINSMSKIGPKFSKSKRGFELTNSLKNSTLRIS